MAILPRNLLKSFFERGDKPTQAQFHAFIDSMLHGVEDQYRIGLRVYDPTRNYLAGDATLYNDCLYTALVNTTGTFNASHWKRLDGDGVLAYVDDQVAALVDGAPPAGDTLNKLYNLIINSSSEITVADIPERDQQDIDEGAHVFVLDDGDGSWALYKAITAGVDAAYVKLSDPDLLNAAMTASQIKASYESNSDTNAFTDSLLAKLMGIQDNATANSTDAQLRDRSTHTGTQPASTISDFSSALRADLAIFGSPLGIGTEAVTPQATLHIKTGGITENTFALRIDNPNVTNVFAIRDTGGIYSTLSTGSHTYSLTNAFFTYAATLNTPGGWYQAYNYSLNCTDPSRYAIAMETYISGVGNFLTAARFMNGNSGTAAYLGNLDSGISVLGGIILGPPYTGNCITIGTSSIQSYAKFFASTSEVDSRGIQIEHGGTSGTNYGSYTYFFNNNATGSSIGSYYNMNGALYTCALKPAVGGISGGTSYILDGLVSGADTNYGIKLRAYSGTNNYGAWIQTDSGSTNNIGVYVTDATGECKALLSKNSTTAGEFLLNLHTDVVSTYALKTDAFNGGVSQSTYGIYAVARTGAGPGTTAIAGYFRAQDAENVYALIVPSSGGRVGIGTDTPTGLFEVAGDDIIISREGRGVILRSPGGLNYRVFVSDDGAVMTEPV